SSVCSILGSSSIIVCLLTQRLSRKPELQPLFLLSVADLLLAACWLVGAVLFCLRCAVLNSLCYNLHILEQVTAPSLSEKVCPRGNNGADDDDGGDDDGGDDDDDDDDDGDSFRLGPVLFMLPVFIMGNMSVCQSNSSQFQFFKHKITFRMLELTLLASHAPLLLQGLVIRARHFHIRAVASNGIVGAEQRVALRVLNQRVVLYPLVFVLCWGPAVALGGGSRTELRPTSLPPPTPFQALTSASQGFLNCLVYGWTTVHLRQVGLTALSRDANTQTPLLRMRFLSRGLPTPSLTKGQDRKTLSLFSSWSFRCNMEELQLTELRCD
uniref:Uncharacterized protein n=1 Tax=Oryzias latipes TaxID=8090 RepID=A0A3P9KJJ4_ORYLA